MSTETFDLGGRSLIAPPGDHVAKWWASGSWYEQDVLDAMSKELRAAGPSDYVVDVGAHIGNHSAWVAMRGRRVLAIEPNAAVLSCLAANVAGLPVTVVGCAAGEAESFATLHPGPRGNTGMARVEFGEQGLVDVRPLDALVRRSGRVVLIKIDVEGSEVAALRGAGATLKEHRPVLVIEAHDAKALAEQAAALAPYGYQRELRSYGRTPTFFWRPS